MRSLAMCLGLALSASVFSGSAGARSDEAAPADFSAAFRAAMMPAIQGDWEMALPAAEAALPLASTPAENYRIRHVLTDINARLGQWEAAAYWSSEAAGIIHDDETLSATLMVMASHMAAEEGRAAIMLGDARRAAQANSRMIADHPDASPGWRVRGDHGAVHSGSGLSCDLMRDGFLRFDVYGGSSGQAACAYWSLANVGVRITAGSVLRAEEARLRERKPDMGLIELNWIELPENARTQTYDLGPPMPGLPSERVMIVETTGFTVTLRYPEPHEGEALEAAARFVDAGLSG